MSSAFQQLQRLRDEILGPRPLCRDCADSDGRCSSDPARPPCDPTEHAIEVVRALKRQRARETAGDTKP